MSTPYSISRDKFDVYADPTECSSILGKRKRGSDEDAQRPSMAIMPPVEFPNQRHTHLTTPGSDSPSSEFDMDEHEDPKVDHEAWSHKDSSSFKSKYRLEKDMLASIDSSSIVKPTNPFINRRIRRRHSLSSLSTKFGSKDENGAESGGNQRPKSQRTEKNGLDSTCPPQTLRTGFPTIYRITCSANNAKNHPTVLYEDDPGKVIFTGRRRSSHISGNKPVYQLQNYVNQFQQSSFVIVKDRTCENRAASFTLRENRNETMIILSDDLRQAIQKVATCPLESNNERGAGKEELLEMSAPYMFLYHHQGPLRVYSQSAEPSLQTMIRALLEYFNNHYAQEYDEALELTSRGMITLYHLEKLYRPNELVAHNFSSSEEVKDLAIHVVENWATVSKSLIIVPSWNWQFNAYECERNVKDLLEVPPIKDNTEPFPIRTLATYPMSFLDDKSMELLQNRGKISWDLRLPNFVHYEEDRTKAHYEYAKSGRYMIDFGMYWRLHMSPNGFRDLRKPQNKQTDSWRLSLSLTDTPKEDEFLMMPTKIPGYDFFEKEWVTMHVSNIKPVKWNKQPFEDLVLPEATKYLVKAMVTIRASSIKKKEDRAGFDIISGKGNGLIMLFHGSPGTGKTLTAESVAEIAEMPLYPITCGDIGTEPDKVEQYLQLVFQLGKRWNCVLLLDEADVFLEERSLTDLQRNSLVSVFLRMLEYYEGILILTSNRVGTFDDAFRSRIHIALHYEELKPRARKQIWLNFLTRLQDTEEGENVEEIRDRLDELSKQNLNGREIRNAMSTARQLASHGNEKLKWEHLELAIKTVNDFGNYLRNVHGHCDREWAREARTR